MSDASSFLLILEFVTSQKENDTVSNQRCLSGESQVESTAVHVHVNVMVHQPAGSENGNNKIREDAPRSPAGAKLDVNVMIHHAANSQVVENITIKENTPRPPAAVNLLTRHFDSIVIGKPYIIHNNKYVYIL